MGVGVETKYLASVLNNMSGTGFMLVWKINGKKTIEKCGRAVAQW